MCNKIEITLFSMNGCGYCIQFKDTWSHIKENFEEALLKKLQGNKKSMKRQKGDNKENNNVVEVRFNEYERFSTENTNAEAVKLKEEMINKGIEIDGYPTIVIKKDEDVTIYEGERDFTKIVKHVANLVKKEQKGGKLETYHHKYKKYRTMYQTLMKKHNMLEKKYEELEMKYNKIKGKK